MNNKLLILNLGSNLCIQSAPTYSLCHKDSKPKNFGGRAYDCMLGPY